MCKTDITRFAVTNVIACNACSIIKVHTLFYEISHFFWPFFESLLVYNKNIRYNRENGFHHIVLKVQVYPLKPLVIRCDTDNNVFLNFVKQ